MKKSGQKKFDPSNPFKPTSKRTGVQHTSPAITPPDGIRYVDVTKRWRKIGPIAKSVYARRIWLPDMLEYRAVRQLMNLKKWGELGWNDEDYFRNATVPREFNSCNWAHHRGHRHPAYWDYVCPRACHWLVNLNLFLATLAMPEHPWRIVTSHDRHSTVWNRDNLLFDMNFLALGVPASEAWELAAMQPQSEFLRPGQHYQGPRCSAIVKRFIAGKVTKEQALVMRFGHADVTGDTDQSVQPAPDSLVA